MTSVSPPKPLHAFVPWYRLEVRRNFIHISHLIRGKVSKWVKNGYKTKIVWYWNLGKKHLFLDVSSTNTDTLIPSLYQCVETRSIEVFWTVLSATSGPPFQPLRHQRNVFHSVMNLFPLQTLHTVNRKRFFMNILCNGSFCPQKRTEVHCSSVVYSSSTVFILTTKTSLWTRACASPI
jgi:hypothetical protein